MIGTFYAISGNPVNKPVINLSDNFKEAIKEAKAAINGREITVNELSEWALIGTDGDKPIRLLVSDK